MQLQRANSESVDSPGLLSSKLPAQIVDRIAERFCAISVMVATFTVAMVAIGSFFQPEFAGALTAPPLLITSIGLLLFSVAIIVIQKRGWLTKTHLLDLSLFYQLAVSFAIGMDETTLAWEPGAPVRGLTFLGLWFFHCAFMLPNAPLKVAVTTALSILSWFGAYWINLAYHGMDPIPANRLAVLVGQMLVCGIWAFIINKRQVSMQLGQLRAEQMGSYEMEERIGYGGMGEVWKAKHKLLRRDAAVKLIRADVLRAATGKQEAALLKRFEREARATAQLRSPHTVALFDYGRAADGTIYYVMELLNGIDLQQMVERFGPLPAGRVINLLIGVSESLEEAHRAGLVHRDIKPKNIFLSKLGLQFDFAKVLDFGLVKLNRQSDAGASLTMEGITAGTPAYLPPEIATDQPNIDGRSDLYSLGCVAYFLLTGQTVFDEQSHMAHAIAHVQKTPIPPSQRTELPIPPSLERIVMQLLEKDPAKRISSAYELARQLRAVKDVPEYCPYTAAEWWNTNLPANAAMEILPEPTTAELDRQVHSPAPVA